MFRRARSRAKRTGREFSITEADVVIPERCPVFNIPLVVGRKDFREAEGGGRENSPSLDRIRNELGYVHGNVAVVSWKANAMKSKHSLEDLEALVAWLRVATKLAPA
jgi:hypothetical protein